jgi:hypothetical protein
MAAGPSAGGASTWPAEVRQDAASEVGWGNKGLGVEPGLNLSAFHFVAPAAESITGSEGPSG